MSLQQTQKLIAQGKPNLVMRQGEAVREFEYLMGSEGPDGTRELTFRVSAGSQGLNVENWNAKQGWEPLFSDVAKVSWAVAIPAQSQSMRKYSSLSAFVALVEDRIVMLTTEFEAAPNGGIDRIYVSHANALSLFGLVEDPRGLYRLDYAGASVVGRQEFSEETVMLLPSRPDGSVDPSRKAILVDPTGRQALAQPIFRDEPSQEQPAASVPPAAAPVSGGLAEPEAPPPPNPH